MWPNQVEYNRIDIHSRALFETKTLSWRLEACCHVDQYYFAQTLKRVSGSLVHLHFSDDSSLLNSSLLKA